MNLKVSLKPQKATIRNIKFNLSLAANSGKDMRQLGFLWILLISISVVKVNAQDYNIGIRAGLNYGKFLGPVSTDVNESFSLSTGFHFGLNFQYNLTDLIGVRGELLYQQNGTKYNYEGDGWYNFTLSNAFDQPNGLFSVVKDFSDVDLEVSNGGISFPITVHFTTLEKWEFFAGVYTNFVFSSIGTGIWKFGPDDAEHKFEQSLNYNYRSDEARQTGFFSSNILLFADGENAVVPEVAGAYYLYPTKSENMFRTADYGAVLGMAYYTNRSLYFSLRMEYGLRDISNNAVDFSYKNVNPDGSLIFESDYDRNLNVALSIGFKF